MANDASRLLKIVISGDAKGALEAFAKTEASTDSLSSKFGSLGSVAAIGGVAVAASVVGIGGALLKIGDNFDQAYDKIRAGTGAVGPQLDQLKDEFRQVVAEVPTDFGKASDAITVVTQKLGEAGPKASAIAEQFLEVSRITKTDLTANLQAGTDALNAWGTTADQQPAKLDEMFRATQASGISFTDLSSQLADVQPVLKSLGFSMDDSIALLATLKKGGVDVSDVMPALSKSLATAAKEGKPASEVFKDTFDIIKNAPNDTAAASTALSIFGARAGPKLAELIREGKLSYEDLAKTIQGGSDTILGAGKDTQDFGEKWELLKNRVLLALEPIASKVFDGIGKAMDKLGPIITKLANWFNNSLMPALARFGSWLSQHQPVLIAIAVVVGGALVAAFVSWAISAGAAAVATIAAVAPVLLIGAAIGTLVAGIIYAYQNWDLFRNVVDTVASFLTGVVWPAIQAGTALLISTAQDLWSVMQAVWNGIATVVQFAWGIIQPIWDNALRPGISLIVNFVETLAQVWQAQWQAVAGAVQWVWGNVLQPIWDNGIRPGMALIVTGARTLQDVWSAVWDAIGKAVQWVWDNVISPVVDKITSAVDTAKSAWNFISSVGSAVGVGDTGFGQEAALHAGANAAGTSFWGGGLTWVGERGPELVDLPTGARVYNAAQSMAMANVGGGTSLSFGEGSVVIYAQDGTDAGRKFVTEVETYIRRGGSFGPATKAALS